MNKFNISNLRNSIAIKINKNGKYFVRPIPVTEDFKEEFQNSLLLIYTNEQRNQDEISKSHENKDKLNILNISKDRLIVLYSRYGSIIVVIRFKKAINNRDNLTTGNILEKL